jgi:two-component system LytT family response regulator
MRALIVDDERIARQELRRLLAAHPEIEVAGEARTGEEALELIERLEPDVVFLDIRMPGMNGFDLLLNLDSVPQVIFFAHAPAAPVWSACSSRMGNAAGSYVSPISSCWNRKATTPAFFARERPLVQRSLAALQERLDPATFFRAGRKHIVNLKWVERIEPAIAGNLLVVLRGGTTVEMSRRQSVRFREALSL